MNYTITKDNVIFELPLSDYLGKSTRYNHQTKERQEFWLNSIQDYEESIFYNFESFAPYISIEEVNKYYNPEKATQYLLEKGYSQEEINLFSDTLENDILRACADAKDSSYQSEWLKKFFKLTQDQIDDDLNDNLSSIKYKLLDRLDDEEFRSSRSDQEYLRLEISLKDVKEWLRENMDGLNIKPDLLLDSFIEYFRDYALDFTRKPIDTEYIDRYNSLGDCDDWLTYFKDYEETSAEIDKYRKDEKEKQNNLERASLETKKPLEDISNYIDKYITQEPAKTKIKRQIGALKSIIKNAL